VTKVVWDDICPVLDLSVVTGAIVELDESGDVPPIPVDCDGTMFVLDCDAEGVNDVCCPVIAAVLANDVLDLVI